MAWQTASIYASNPAIIDPNSPTAHYTVGETASFSNNNREMLMQFILPSELSDKKIDITNSFLYVQHRVTDATHVFLGGSYWSLKEDYNAATVTYVDRPSVTGDLINQYSYVQESPYVVKYPIRYTVAWLAGYTIKHGIQLSPYASGADVYTPNSSKKPYITLNYNDDISFYTIGGLYPESTYKTQDTLFMWSLYDSESGFPVIDSPTNINYTHVLQPPTQTSATLKWRTAAGQTEHSVSAGTNAFVTVPANTFTSDTVQWMVTASYSNGMTRSSEWKTISTVDTTPTVIPQTPSNAVIDGSTATEFRWEYSNDSGSAPTGYTLETSIDGTAWTTLSENLNTDAVTYTAPANTFSAGQMYWRVKGYNVDGVGSEWSAAVSNIVIAPPLTPAVSVSTTTPFPVITWQTTGQQGFEIEIDGVSSGIKFGTSQTYKWIEALSDGTRGVRVRAQNSYGIWSEWGGATFTVTNVPGDAITLAVTASESVRLMWETDGNYDKYIVYRDGVKLAETTAADYTDHKAIGSAVYTVRGIYGDYYTMSNDVTAAVTIDSVIIRAEDGNEWLTLKFVAASDRHNTISHTQNVSYQHYSGATYPMATIGTARDYVYSFAVAFKDIAECKRFEELLGKVVTLKDAWQNCVTGVLDGYSIDSSRFYQSYGCTIRQVE